MAENTALSTAEQNALIISYDVLGSHVELTLDFVKKYLVRGRADLTSDQEVVFFMNTCKMQKLNPLVQGECYLIKYSEKEPAQMVVGKDAYLRRAYDNPNYLQKQDGIIVQRGNEIIKKEGCCLYPGEALIGGWCRVFFVKRDAERTAYKEVSLSEYDKGMANWKSKPATMINKVAISQCVRDAFPKDYEGLYSEEEMVASGVVVVGKDGEVVVNDPPAADEKDDPVVTQEQRQTLFRAAQAEFGKEDGNNLIKRLISEAGYESTTNMPSSVYGKVWTKLMDACEAHRNELAQRSCENPDDAPAE